uniref:rhomboid protease n=1 Tax=Aplanochytrium stocchinoi TaxID=215587 RepID=A0A7S3PR50_9STRA|mmetsp:Transcript_14990/g.18552  ORF Transcript_14990/g.18552 Transcript_14990/m.18552 type:complete len:428 (-) Transcript_14990:90-1373(-)|eukprot:CAMPEP_0204835076 /NCGR_PEP_ID=MMETSP1346-20131115/21558_1 /ASSEMBLY_ACC=CAM_ASM_000771 /TAXON_ID=215587 /ORGANISM="Aplanochytrium stocchinoi, Strain GSBS06" /LENGTH=427 /DNA_ID=CAMNT_0051968779 /DNA_START=156 /DNA_END=1439 /DNA_ORIENTATION=-
MDNYDEDAALRAALEESAVDAGVQVMDPRYSTTSGLSLESDNPIYGAGIRSSERSRRPSADPNDPTNRSSLRRSMQRNPELAVAAAIDERTLRRQKTFHGAFFGKEKEVKPWFTRFMIGTCTLVMLVEVLINNKEQGKPFEDFSLNPLFGPSIEVLLLMGAKRTDLIVQEGDWYRLFMPMFLHGGILHLLFNMAFLYSFGSSLEREFGHTRVAYIYVTSGFFGVLCSAIFNPTIPSIGASGACYGLIGAAWADFLLNFSFYRDQWKCVFAQLFFGTAFNACLGLIPQLDNFAHLGGLVCGFFTGLSVLTLPRYDLYSDLKPDKLYQICLKSIGIFITPIVIIIFIIILYVQVDVESYCPWCIYLSCVPTPWWGCGVQCEEGFSIEINGINSTIVCPRNIGIKEGPTPADLATNQDVQLAFCRDLCLD